MSKVALTIEGFLGIITLSDPPLNLISPELADDLLATVLSLQQKELRGLIIKSEGNFSAGANMSLFIGKDAKGGKKILDTFLVGIVRNIEALPYPTLAVVRGLCLGGGLELALACDLIWASQEARFGAVEATIGTVPLGAGSRMIAARAGVARAKEMVFEAKMYTADQMEKWNIVNKVVLDAEINEQALVYMARIAQGPTLAYGVSKKLNSAYYNEGRNSSDDLLLEIVPPLFETDDFIGGVKSLMENGPGKAKFTAK